MLYIEKRLLCLLLYIMSTILVPCVTTQGATRDDFVAPDIKIIWFEVPHYDGYWYMSNEAKPTKGQAGDYGAILPMSFLFEVQNPNSYPICLKEMLFTITFDGVFDVATINNQDYNWIPAFGSDQIRVTTMITVRSALVNLLATGELKLKDKDWTSWDTLERWWKGVPNYSVPVMVKDGSFTFSANGALKVCPFKATAP